MNQCHILKFWPKVYSREYFNSEDFFGVTEARSCLYWQAGIKRRKVGWTNKKRAHPLLPEIFLGKNNEGGLVVCQYALNDRRHFPSEPKFETDRAWEKKQKQSETTRKSQATKLHFGKCKGKCKRVQGWLREWRQQWVTDKLQNPTPRSKKVRNFLTGIFDEELFDRKNFLRNFLTGGGRVAKRHTFLANRTQHSCHLMK